MPSSNADELARFRAQFAEHADAGYRERFRKSSTTQYEVFGVRTPQLRKMVRTWRKAHKKISCAALLSLTEALWADGARESHDIAVLLLEAYPQCLAALPWDVFERWRHDLDSWDMTDGLGWLLGAWVLGEPEARCEHLRMLINDADVWSRRFALVATARINRGATGFTAPDLTLELVGQVKDERHPMVTKAVSWALRELIRHHHEEVAAYLAENETALASHVVREVRNKLETGLKRGKM